MPKPSPPSNESRAISALEVYPLQEACRRLGWGRKTFWAAERAGLRAVAFGRQKFLTGREILAFFRRLEGGHDEQ